MKRSAPEPIDKEAKEQNTGHGPALMWFRNDLRIHDNPALSAASEFAGLCGGLHALFLVDKPTWVSLEWAHSKIDFVLRTLQILRQDLMEYNIPLQVIERQGSEDHANILSEFCKEKGIKSVYWNAEYEAIQTQLDERVSDYLVNGLGIPCCVFHEQCIVQPGLLKTKSGDKPFTVFTPFKKAWDAHIANDPITVFEQPIKQEKVEPYKLNDIPKLKEIFTEWSLPAQICEEWPAGEEEAIKRLDSFLKYSIQKYKTNRDFPALNGTSRLSAYLSIGAISARLCLQHAQMASHVSEGASSWINELCWRDFYRHILFFFPQVSQGLPFKEITVNVPWRNITDDDVKRDFESWRQGKTGYPIVDAAMRCLEQTGWMHNRLRMLTAMFLSKHLLIWWPLGEKWFMNNLIDGDQASNNGGWQWSASTGTDSQPYFRLFNPITQSERYDPEAEFIKQWVPELKGLSNMEAHFPFDRISRKRFDSLNYPMPIVEHKAARERCLTAFKSIYK